MGASCSCSLARSQSRCQLGTRILKAWLRKDLLPSSLTWYWQELSGAHLLPGDIHFLTCRPFHKAAHNRAASFPQWELERVPKMEGKVFVYQPKNDIPSSSLPHSVPILKGGIIQKRDNQELRIIRGHLSCCLPHPLFYFILFFLLSLGPWVIDFPPIAQSCSVTWSNQVLLFFTWCFLLSVCFCMFVPFFLYCAFDRNIIKAMPFISTLVLCGSIYTSICFSIFLVTFLYSSLCNWGWFYSPSSYILSKVSDQFTLTQT